MGRMSGTPESVWAYPRPPRVEPSDEEVVVVLGGVEVARTNAALRVLETSHPPTYYLPPADIADVVVHALVAPAHARLDTVEVQPVAPVQPAPESRDGGSAVP